MKEKKLLFSLTATDFKWDYFRCSGAGGQHVDKTSSGVRCTHIPSGASSTSCVTRQQGKNKSDAFRKCCQLPQFQRWCRVEASKRLGKPSIDDIVDNIMEAENNFKLEVKNKEGKWVEISLEDFLAVS